MAPQANLVARQNDTGYYVPFWYTTTGYIVRWTLFGVFVALILLWVVGGYFHARSRMKKGLPLRAYHSCFFPRQPRLQQSSGWYRPSQNPYGQQDGYNMNYMPPPTYDGNRPPEYQQGPPPGAKADTSQWNNQPTTSTGGGAGLAPQYEAPPGPPPPAVARHGYA